MSRRGVLTITATAVLLQAAAGTAWAYPPMPPGEQQTREHLATLTVAADGPMDGYDRDKFEHWTDADGDGCDTRDELLIRDGVDVTIGSGCEPTGGRWYSVYDSQWVSDDSDVHIDHVVALAEAWRTGAADWRPVQRKAFANDLQSQELIAVSGSSNLSKSDDGPAEWKPSNAGYRCMFARSYINIKYIYNLTATTTEKRALKAMLDRC